jgi:UDP-N-acetyl-D-galactosamine dehydrogenase
MKEARPSQSKITDKTVVCIIGLGYVGLPLAETFARTLLVIGFDINAQKVHEANRHVSPITDYPSRITPPPSPTFTTDALKIRQADFIIIAVPTPVTGSKEPDLSYVLGAAQITGRNMKKGSTVILESTVYPGVTEDVVKPVLEKESGFQCGRDFKIAYSPERINPGDKEHTLDKITKVVAGMDEETAELVAELYRRVTPHIFKTKDIRTAEAAKVIENIQRDLNIALMNELSLIFARMGLSTKDILEAAGTKWNFHTYFPGLIGGHCIPVDPYYLVYKAKELGYHPQVILAGRAINDSMPRQIADMTVKALNNVGKVIKGSKVLIMGLTYKENVADTRETPVKEIIKELQEYGVDIYGYDPLLSDIEQEFGIKAQEFRLSTNDSRLATNLFDCVILAVVHDAFKNITLDELKGSMNDNPILIDVRGFFDERQAKQRGLLYRTL